MGVHHYAERFMNKFYALQFLAAVLFYAQNCASNFLSKGSGSGHLSKTSQPGIALNWVSL